MKFNPRKAGGGVPTAHTLVEVVVSIFALAIMLVSLYGGFSAGFAVVQLARENLRATQIMMQKTETVRLLKWSQLMDTNTYLRPTFTDYYDPGATNVSSHGATYQGFVSTNAVTGVPNDYKNNMLAVNISIYWTNYPHGSSGPLIVRTRQMQTFVARYGMQNYVYQ
jgi:hypothetical protein